MLTQNSIGHTAIGVGILPNEGEPEQSRLCVVLRKAGRKKKQKNREDYVEDLRYKFPGGGSEEEEDPIDTMIRELRGEAGLIVSEQMVVAEWHSNIKESYRPEYDYHQSHFYLLLLDKDIDTVEFTEVEEVERVIFPSIKMLPSVYGNPPMTKGQLIIVPKLLWHVENQYEWAHPCRVAVEKQLPPPPSQFR
ncbi:NUDIX domain-containing protein [bacterium]|nr:NUDIX domain-containing protein [bacterium]